MSKKSKQEPVWTSFTKSIAVCSQDERNNKIKFLVREAEIDKENYQEMLNSVDLSTLTKAKIAKLGKLGGQYAKASKSLIKKYKEAKVIT